MNEPLRVRWDLLIMLMASWNWFSIPLEISIKPAFTESILYFVVNCIIDILFCFDILITFRTTFVRSSTGEEVSEPSKIAIQYLKGQFWIDLLATLPFDLMSGGDPRFKFTNLFGLLKTTRVLRISRLIKFINARDDVKLTLKLLQLFYFLWLYLHMIGCCWFIIYDSEGTWIPPSDYPFVKTNIYNQGEMIRYLNAFYFSINMLNGNEQGPRSVPTIVFVCIIMIVGAMVNANIFGSMAVIIEELNKKASRFQRKIDIANTAMKNLYISNDLKHRVINYLLYTQSNRDHQRELEAFKQMISPSLQMEVTKFIFSSIIKSNPVMKDLKPKLTEYILQNVDTILCLPEDQIIKQGDDPDNLYFLSKGECEVMIKDENNIESIIQNLKIGAMFGEIALVSNCKRTATVKCLNYNICASVNNKTFKEMWRLFPEVVAVLKKTRSEYNDKWKSFLKKLIKKTEYFKDLSFMTQEELLYSLHPETFEEGQIIFDNNDVIQNLYFVSEGEISIVLQLDNGEEVITDMLTPGSNFGTYSILKDNKQMFTFKANTFVCVQVLEREALGKCRDQFKDLNNVLLDYENYIEEVGIPACDYKTTEMNLKEKFRLAVNRSMVLNEYENKKNSKLGMLIEQLKKQHAENEIKEVKMAKRSEYKRSLGKLISEHFKENMPNYDESTMYTIEVFKFMNKLIDKLNVRIQTFDIIKEGMRLLHLALNGKSDDELEVIPEAGQDNFDFDYEDETQINEGNTGMPVLDSMDFKNEEKKSQKIFSLKHNEEEKISSKRTNEQMNDSDIINEYAKELDLE